MFENIIVERKECFKIFMSGVVILMNCRYFYSICSMCFFFGEKIDKYRWFLLFLEEME